jgi:error-prone DNA polymerase
MSSSSVSLPDYAELHCLTNFSFLRGASHAEEMVMRAHELGYRALAVTDECSVAGVVRAHAAAKRCRLPIIVGSEFELECGLRFVALAPDRLAYGRLARLITRGRRAAPKGTYRLVRADVEEILSGCLTLWLPGSPPIVDEGRWLLEHSLRTTWLAAELFLDGTGTSRLKGLQEVARKLEMPMVASGDVHMHVRARRYLQDSLTAIRLGVPLARAGCSLYPNGERYLRERQRLARLYPPELLQQTVSIAERCTFSLDELRYEYPREVVPDGETPLSYLRRITEEGARRRWPEGVQENVRAMIEHELKLIADLRYEPYFLTVYDIVNFARKERILCQGRGSAANSVVCYCLGVTEVDPARMSTLVERFISRERNEPPDIDIDFEHERREEVIQYIYRKYGRDRAALAATVISYQPRSALRDLAKCFGLSPDEAARLSGAMQWWDGSTIDPSRIREAGYDPTDPSIAWILRLAAEIMRFPRHLSQHVGGFVISEGPLEELVPIENAAMAERVVIQWDKDDLDDLGLIKVDVLGLGMLTAIRKTLQLIGDFRRKPVTMSDVPAEDPVVYEMACRADTVGVFQIESRAQMSMLPRLKPRSFYDLVIEIAIVRPGPIQGDMVHPYLRRRMGLEPVTYPGPEVEKVLCRTLGVPLFQEQVMQLAMVAAGFTPGEADQLRRAMAAWKRRGGLEPFQARLMSGMRDRGYTDEFAERVCRQIKGFGDYGFPEVHSCSFALLAYVSAWLKCHEPAAFTCGLLNSQPMGFYAPAQLIRDAREHGVEVRPVDVSCSDYDCSLERGRDGKSVLRLGLRMVRSLSETGGHRVVSVRGNTPYESVQEVIERAQMDRRDIEALAAAGALSGLTGNRHLAFWQVAAAERPMLLAMNSRAPNELLEGHPLLPLPTEGQNIVADYHATGLSLGRHPVALLRNRFERARAWSAESLKTAKNGARVQIVGVVVTRQRPGSAGGVTFVTLEDETGSVNLIVWQTVGERYRRALVESRLLEVEGTLQREGDEEHFVIHVIASRLFDRSVLLGELVTRSRNFR